MGYVYRNNFTGGELSPALEARPDLKEYTNGLRRCENFVPMSQGGLVSRPGIRRIASVFFPLYSFAPRLLPFVFSRSEAYAVVAFTAAPPPLGGNYQEKLYTLVYSMSGTAVYYHEQALGPIDSVPAFYPATVKAGEYAQQLDVMVLPLTGSKYARLPGLYRSGINTFSVTPDISETNINSANTPRNPKSSLSASWSGTFGGQWPGSTDQICTCTLADIPHTSWSPITSTSAWEDLLKDGVAYKIKIGSLFYYAQLIDSTISGANVSLRLRFADNSQVAASTAATFYWDAVADEGTPPSGSTRMFMYKVSAVDHDGQEHEVSLPWGATAAPLTDDHGIRLMWGPPYGGTNGAIDWEDVEYYRVYKCTSAGAFDSYGWIGDTEIPVFVDYNIAPSGADAPFTKLLQHPRPACAAFYQQRLVVAGGPDKDVTYTSSRTGFPFSFLRRTPLRADDAFQTTAYVSRFDRILHMIDRGTLYLFTEGGISIINQGSQGVYTAATAGVTQVSTGHGCSADCKPISVGTDILYVSAAGNVVRRLDAQNGDVDLTLRARHLFEGEKIIQLAYMQTPRSLVFCVTDSGKLLVLCYQPEERIWAWSRMTLSQRGSSDPQVYGAICLPSGGVDVLYLLTNGGLYTMDFREDQYVGLDDWVPATVDLADLTKLTCTYYGGETVDVVADGLLYKGVTFDGSGVAHLPSPVLDTGSVVVGLPLTATADLMPLVGDSVERTEPKAVSSVHVHVRNTRDVQAGIIRTDGSDTAIHEARPRDVSSGYGAPAPYTGPLDVYVDGPWDRDASLRVQHTAPFYCEILGVEYEVST